MGDPFAWRIAFTDAVVEHLEDEMSGTTARVTFSSDPEGTSLLSSSRDGPPLPAFSKPGDPPFYYEVATEGEFSDPLTVCIDYSKTAYEDDSELKLLQFEDGEWQDRTVFLDTGATTICGSSSFLSQATTTTTANVSFGSEPSGSYCVCELTKLYFAHFGKGKGFTSDIVLSNPNGEEPCSTEDEEAECEFTPCCGTVEFYDNDGKALEVGVDKMAPKSKVTIPPIPALGTVTISTDGEGGLAAGSVVVTANRELGGVIRFGLPGIGIAGVGGSSDLLEKFIAPVRRTSGGINTGIAVYNPGDAVTLTLTLRNMQGVVTSVTEPISEKGLSSALRSCRSVFST